MNVIMFIKIKDQKNNARKIKTFRQKFGIIEMVI